MRDARVCWAMRRRSATPDTEARLRRMPEGRLASGPGLVTVAFGIDRSHSGADLCEPRSALRLETAAATDRPPQIVTTPRIGIAYAPAPWQDHPWRFVDATSASVSGPPRRIR